MFALKIDKNTRNVSKQNFYSKHNFLSIKTKSLKIYLIKGHIQDPPAFQIHPVKFENRLPIEGKA